MKILSVHATDFRAYPSLEWTLPDSGLYMIDAVTDTGRSNMAGKTTLLDSIFWGLFGWLPKWNGPKGGPVDAVVRRGATGCKVSVTFENNGSIVNVVRQRPNKLQVYQDNQEIHGKSADLDKRIEQLLGMTASQFLLSVYIAQDRGNSFFTMTDNERTQLLSVIAGLEELDKGLALAKQRRETAQASLDKVEGALSVLKEQFDGLPAKKMACHYDISVKNSELVTRRQDLAGIVSGAEQEEALSVQSWNTEYLQLQNEYGDRTAELRSEREEYAARHDSLSSLLGQQPKVESQYFRAVSDLETKIAEIEAYNKEQEKLRLRNYQRVEKINKALDDAERAGQGKCSTCKQDLPQWDKEAHAQKFIDQAHKFQNEIEEESENLSVDEFKLALRRAQDDLARRKAEIEAQPNQIKQELAVVSSSVSNIDAQLDKLASDLEYHKVRGEAELNRKVSAIRQKVKDIQSEIRNKELALDHANKALQDVEAIEADIQAKIDENKDKQALLTQELNEALDLIDLFGPKGFRSICFDGLIERISQRAGQLFSLMTDDIYSTSLVQIREDSKGSSKPVLRPVITKGGQEVPMDDLSGGARRMAMLAYDVAVSETVADSAPLLLDEALDGLDVVGKGEAMRLLESVSMTRPVFVIDHSSEFKSSFNKVLTVVHKNGESHLG